MLVFTMLLIIAALFTAGTNYAKGDRGVAAFDVIIGLYALISLIGQVKMGVVC